VVRDRTLGSRIFEISNAVFLTIFAILTIIPVFYIIVASFTSTGVITLPITFSLDGYRYIFSTNSILNGLGVSVYLTIVGTIFNLLFTSLMAYPLARTDLIGRRPIMFLVLFSMLFNGGFIPTYLVVKNLGLLDSLWSLIFVGLINAFNLIVLRNFFMQLPEALEESAKIDGCNDYGILFRIILPLSGPAIATFALFYAVGHWNAYFSAILYINDPMKWPIQVWLRQIVILSQGGIGDSLGTESATIMPPASAIKNAVIVVATVPIVMVYPFLQKHFTKGILLGSIKG
jgi:putative aldouronate transport system permease protein